MDLVDNYINSLDGIKKETASTLTNFIRQTYPDIDETFEHNMPAYKVDGKLVLSFAALKSYFSFYTNDTRILKLTKELLPGTSLGKSCARIKYSEENLIEILIDICKEAIDSAVYNRGDNISDFKALKKWNDISPEHQQLLLNNVFCLNCKITSMIDYTVQNDRYGIVLKGKCKSCGGKVARFVEDID
jgi:hypothetical protein